MGVVQVSSGRTCPGPAGREGPRHVGVKGGGGGGPGSPKVLTPTQYHPADIRVFFQDPSLPFPLLVLQG